MHTINFKQLSSDIKSWGKEFGFQEIGITDIDLSQAEQRLQDWLAKKFHGHMGYMERHGTKRTRPDELIPGTIRVISARIDYLPEYNLEQELQNPQNGYIAAYALGRDYHKIIRKRLSQLAKRIQAAVGDFGYRVFADSAPVMEKPLAEKAGLGWIGKNTNLIHAKTGSWFFIGTIYVDLPLDIDRAQDKSHCGSCRACMDVCPTQAIVAPYVLDAKRCISYLTIELKGSIPLEMRGLIGNRIYGCDDCQLYCPWNKFAKPSQDEAFKPRKDLTGTALVELFNWNEALYLEKTRGTAIQDALKRHGGYEIWLRNIAVALGNAPTSPEVVAALKARLEYPSAIVREHVQWALQQHE